jgi:ProQ/FINO family
MKNSTPAQATRPTIKANARQLEALSKRVAELPAPPAPPPAPAPAPLAPASKKKLIPLRVQIIHSAMKVRRTLAKRFPRCFCDFGQPRRPLKIGIFADIIERASDIERHDLINALADYCGGGSYHAACVEGAERVDLDGNVTGIVTKGEAAHSARKLRKLKRQQEVRHVDRE